MKLSDHSMTDILYQQRQATLLAAIQGPTTSLDLAKKIGGNRKHITRKLRALEAAGQVVAIGQKGRGGAIVWGQVA